MHLPDNNDGSSLSGPNVPYLLLLPPQRLPLPPISRPGLLVFLPGAQPPSPTAFFFSTRLDKPRQHPTEQRWCVSLSPHLLSSSLTNTLPSQAKKWTAERNERLLLLTVKDLKVDANKLAKAWGDQYGTLRGSWTLKPQDFADSGSSGNDEFQPTARAITEQFAVLKKKATGGKGGAMKASTVPS